MNSPEGPNTEPEKPTLEQMQVELLASGWQYSVDDDGTPSYGRTYPRVNPLLRGDDWRQAIHDYFDLVDTTAPDLPGIHLTTHGGETDLSVFAIADSTDVDEVTGVYILNSHLRERGFEEIDERLLSDWMTLKGGPGVPELGSKAHYEQHPRSAELRGLSLEFIQYYKQVTASEGMESEAMGRLLDLNKRLAGLAVEPDVHTDAPPVAFIDPVKRVEWAAGQLRSMLIAGMGLSGRKGLVPKEDQDAVKADDETEVPTEPSERYSPGQVLWQLVKMEQFLDAETDDRDR